MNYTRLKVNGGGIAVAVMKNSPEIVIRMDHFPNSTKEHVVSLTREDAIYLTKVLQLVIDTGSLVGSQDIAA